MMKQIQISVLLIVILILLVGQESKGDHQTSAAVVSVYDLSPEMNATSPTPSQQRSELRTFTITSQEEDEYKFRVEYSYGGERGSTGVRLVIWPLLSNGKRVPGILSGSDGEIRVDKGSITGSIASPPKFSHYPPAISTKLRACFFDKNGKEFGCKTFNAVTKWRMRSRPITPRGPNSISDDEAWNVFWSRFRDAVNKRDRVALRAMMSLKFEYEFEQVGPSEALQQLGYRNNQGWSALNSVVSKGAVAYTPPRQWGMKGPVRIAPPAAAGTSYTNYRAIFEKTNGRWRWVAFNVGD